MLTIYEILLAKQPEVIKDWKRRYRRWKPSGLKSKSIVSGEYEYEKERYTVQVMTEPVTTAYEEVK